MLRGIWSKEVVCQVELVREQVGNENAEFVVPLLLRVRWVHFVGFYFPLIEAFFNRFTQSRQLILKEQSSKAPIRGTQIVGQLFSLYANGTMLRLTCHTHQPEAQISAPTIDLRLLESSLKAHFMNSLKESLMIRRGNDSQKILKLEMKIQHSDKMFLSFQCGELMAYKGKAGTDDQGCLGSNFLFRESTMIPVRIELPGHRLERKAQINTTLREFLLQLFGEQTVGDWSFFVHSVCASELWDEPMSKLDCLSHPDGFLYLTAKPSSNKPITESVP